MYNHTGTQSSRRALIKMTPPAKYVQARNASASSTAPLQMISKVVMRQMYNKTALDKMGSFPYHVEGYPMRILQLTWLNRSTSINSPIIL